MFSAIRKRMHVSPATAIATLALVFAMTGGAYAAGKYLITSTKQISPKVLKSLKGANGKAGAPGATGPAGAAGPAGATGPGGPAGGAGPAGNNGSNGESVTNTALVGNKGGCKEGGVEFKVGSGAPTKACNGEKGKQGEPWTAGGTLPEGKTEKGAWSATIGKNFEGGLTGYAPISFGIPLAAAPTVVYVTEAEGSHAPECPGSAAEPEAAAGSLCVYTAAQSLTTLEGSEATKAGAFLSFAGGKIGTTEVFGVAVHGTWAVTG